MLVMVHKRYATWCGESIDTADRGCAGNRHWPAQVGRIRLVSCRNLASLQYYAISTSHSRRTVERRYRFWNEWGSVNLLITLAGAGLIAVGLYDQYRTLFQPSGRGVVSKHVAHATWQSVRRLAARHPAILSMGGPLAFISSVIVWGTLMIVGFALVYYPWMPEGFVYDPGLVPSETSGFLDALYLSIVTAATVGFGDITPASSWLQIVVPLQALNGFLIWTATISWLLSIYPDLSTRQVVAREASLLRDAEKRTGIDLLSLPESIGERKLDELAGRIVEIRGDLLQFPVTYYFHESDETSSLPATLPYLLDLANRASARSNPPGVRLQGERLHQALDDLSQTLATRFLFVEDRSPERVFALYAAEHAPSHG